MQSKGKARKYIFNMTLVNSYGSADIQVLQDDDKPLKLTGNNNLLLLEIIMRLVANTGLKYIIVTLITS